jgi:hypothetical protein
MVASLSPLNIPHVHRKLESENRSGIIFSTPNITKRMENDGL